MNFGVHVGTHENDPGSGHTREQSSSCVHKNQ